VNLALFEIALLWCISYSLFETFWS